MAINPAYLLNPSSIAGLVTDYRDWQIPLGRRFRSLKIWWVLRVYGVRKIREMIRRHVGLGEVFASLCTSDMGKAVGIEVVAGPSFGLTVFRIVEQGDEPVTREPGKMLAKAKEIGKEKSNDLTKKVYERINAKGEIFITSSVLEGAFVIRVVSANELSEEK
ncbi:MAG: hypothetical protein M1831_004247 [Alyxoria varia]|nr:MAG: hypothetical protein M1831_004247 [Alyxoria varia]